MDLCQHALGFPNDLSQKLFDIGFCFRGRCVVAYTQYCGDEAGNGFQITAQTSRRALLYHALLRMDSPLEINVSDRNLGD
jgi:hypothetical protein